MLKLFISQCIWQGLTGIFHTQQTCHHVIIYIIILRYVLRIARVRTVIVYYTVRDVRTTRRYHHRNPI